MIKWYGIVLEMSSSTILGFAHVQEAAGRRIVRVVNNPNTYFTHSTQASARVGFRGISKREDPSSPGSSLKVPNF
jgi:hypothetical protein